MKIVVYSMNGCAQCVQASMLLTQKGILHEVVKVDEDEEAYEVFKEMGHRSVPQIYLVQGGNTENLLYVHLFDYKGLLKLTAEDFAKLK